MKPTASRRSLRGARALRLIVCSLLVGVVAASPGVQWKYVSSVSMEQGFIVPPLEVEAAITGYSSPSPSSVKYDFSVYGTCKPGSYAKSHRLYLKRNSTGQEWTPFYKVLSGANVDTVLSETLNLSAAEKASVVAACNKFLQGELAGGKPLASILGQEHKVPGPKLFQARYEFTCGPFEHYTDLMEDARTPWTDLHNPVRCKAAAATSPGALKGPGPLPPPPGPQVLAVPFTVTKAVLQAVPVKQTTECPAKVTVNGVMQTAGPGTVNYRVWHGGALGPINQLTFQKGGSPLPIQFELSVGKSPGAAEAAPRSAKPGTAGLQLASPLATGALSGCVRLDITQPTEGLKKSNEACYSVVCKAAGPGVPGGRLAAPLPDLMIAGFTVQGASGGAAEVRNIGSAASKATQLKTFVSVGGRTQTFTTAVPPLAPGATTKIKVLFPGLLTGQVRGYSIKLRVDDPNVVKESNESNNSHVH